MNGLENIQEGQGFMLMIVGLTVVFSALVILMFLMKGLKRYQSLLHDRKTRRERAGQPGQQVVGEDDIPGVVVAAIALTILLEEEQSHDSESMVLTLRGMPKPYSNWWQSRIDSAWGAHTTPGRYAALQTADPERGSRV